MTNHRSTVTSQALIPHAAALLRHRFAEAVLSAPDGAWWIGPLSTPYGDALRYDHTGSYRTVDAFVRALVGDKADGWQQVADDMCGEILSRELLQSQRDVRRHFLPRWGPTDWWPPRTRKIRAENLSHSLDEIAFLDLASEIAQATADHLNREIPR